MTPVELSAVAGAIATLVGAWVAVRKMRPDRDQLIITSTQGATTILNDLVRTLYNEIDRLRVQEAAQEKRIEKLQKELDDAHAESEGLRRKHGERRADG